MIRSTTVGTLKTYRSNLNKSFLKQNLARDTVLSQRNFNSYAEDPAAAARAFQLRRSRMSTKSQYDVADSTYRKYQSGWSSLLTVVDTVDNKTKNSVKEADLKALNDPTGDARRALGKELNELADTIVQTMNGKYGESFIFAGADGDNVPFTWEGDQLCYRGVPVDASVSDVAKQGSGDLIPVNADGEYDAAGTNYIKGKTALVAADEVETDPPLLKDADGKRVMVDPQGNMTTDGTGVYLDTDKMSTVAAADYTGVPSTDISILKDENGDPVTVNSAGEIDPDGAYYLTWDLDGALPQTPPVAVTVTSEVLKDANGDPVMFDEDGNIDPDGSYYMTTEGTEVMTQEEYDEECENVAKLDYLSKEAYYVDIGLGFKENENGELIKSSGFNAALQGINFLGYGVDEDGDPKNIVSLVKKMAKICTDESGPFDWDEFDRLTGKVEAASAELHTMHDDMDAATNKLKNNMGLLEDNFYTLQEQYSDLEDVDMADAITSFVWAQYCYNAALKVGNSILSQSLMDYMN